MTDQGRVYAEFVEAELGHEYRRRDRFDTRASNVVASTAGLVTISLVLIAALRGDDFLPTGGALTSLGLAWTSFVGSAVLATLAARDWSYEVLSVRSMQSMLSNHWTDSEVSARNHTAEARLRTLSSLRAVNNRKASLLQVALVLQVLAVAGLAIAIVLVIK